MKRSIPLLIALALLLAFSAPARVHPKDKPRQNHDIENLQIIQLERMQQMKLEMLLDEGILGLKPQMTVLEIGSGVGTLSLEIAKRLHDGGKVYCTDIVPERVEIVKERAKGQGLKNVFPILVKEEGVDDFYLTQRFDLILAANIYRGLSDRVEYFKTLKQALAPGGRLVVIHGKAATFFHESEVRDFKGLLNTMADPKTQKSSFFTKLRKSTQEAILDLGDKTPGPELKQAVIKDFNEMLADPKFHQTIQSRLSKKVFSFSPSEDDYFGWLVLSLNESGIVDKPKSTLSALELRSVIKTNRLIFHDRFRAHLPLNDSPHISRFHLQVSRYVAEHELEKAGYQLDHSYDDLHYFDVLFFRAKEE